MEGKLTDVLIEEQYLKDDTGLATFYQFYVWADAGMKNVILAVPGVLTAYDFPFPPRYEVCIDPRYDREFVKAEIEAAIKCAPEV